MDEKERRRKRNNESARKYRQAHPERRLLTTAKQRAKQLGLPFAITEDDVKIPTHCPVLGLKLVPGGWPSDNSPSIDRIVPELGYVPGNVIVVSFRSNRLKSDATPEELQAIADFYAGLRP